MSAAHDVRVHAAATCLDAATAAMRGFLEHLPEAVTLSSLPRGWSPARHAWHVALTNEVFLGVIRGDGPLKAVSGDSAFSDDRWNFNLPTVGVAAPSILVPPAGVSRVDSVARLSESAAQLAPAIRALDERQARLSVTLPWATVSIYQMAEWAAGHTLRHLSQVGRELQQLSARGLLPSA